MSGSAGVAVAVSPHLDDAVFSAGGTIAALAVAGWTVRVITCCTATVADPSPFALSTQADKGLAADVDYMELRRAEDTAACALLDAEPVHVPLPEAPHRGYTSAADLFAGVHADDPIAGPLADALRPLLHDADLVLAPQAIGDHADHRVVAEVVARLRPDALWWRDTPYVLRRPTAAPWTAVPPGGEQAVAVGAHLDVKAAAARCYATQLGFQFGGPEHVAPLLRELADVEAARLGAPAPVEAFTVGDGYHVPGIGVPGIGVPGIGVPGIGPVASRAVEPRASGRLARALEPLHAMTYFAPETELHLTAAGVEPGRMTYFAGRSAPMGAVGAGVVAAAFYNFNPALVARHIPAAWALADPATLVTARFAAVDAALRRMLGDDVVASPEVAEAATLARRAAQACSPVGRPLAAAHLDLEWPTAPHLVLWHALSILREHRGDGHVTVLLGAELDGIEALVSHTASGRGFVVPFAMATRGWTQEQWDAAVERLRGRGILDGTGVPTLDGDTLRKRIEDETNRLGAAPWSHLGEDGAARLGELGGALVGALRAAGCFPDGVFAAAR